MKTTTQFRPALLSRPVSLCRWLASILLLLASPATSSLVAQVGVRLGWTEIPGGVEAYWTSPSLTPVAPFVHYEFQVQYSVNLSDWENTALISGGFLGSASAQHTYHLPATNTQGFIRLSYRLNMPGADLGGLDLSGSDLRGANLAGANLSGTKLDGALLAGADLTGASLAGATFGGANLQDVNLDGFDLSGLDLSTILGTPVLTQVSANPAGNAAELVPHLPYNTDGTDLVASDPNLAGILSTRNAMLMLKTNATVGQLNALLAAHGASIVASSPADATLPNAVLMASFPSASAQALYDLTVALSEDPIIEAAAPDVLMGLAVVPNDTGADPGWMWDNHGVSAGGNWGLEKARVPEMWNVYNALQNKGAGQVPTCIIDTSFSSHADLSFASRLGSAPLAIIDHGNHVSGIVGATYGNRLGIDGVNPLAWLIGYTFRAVANDFPSTNLPAGSFERGRQANAYSMIVDVRAALRLVPGIKILNMSLAYNWYRVTNAARPTITSPFTASQLAYIEFVAAKYGALMRGVAAASSSVLIVCGAGNDSSPGNLLPARLGSPMCTAALTFGAPNILVVGSHDMNGAASTFSNDGAHVLAPGEGILSTAGTSFTNYVTSDGTSMASPFVAGVAGYLLAVDPTLTPAALKTLIGINGLNVDAFSSLMKIDQLSGRKDVLSMLLDIDDGSADGSLRVKVPEASLARDRAFEEVRGPDFTDLTGVVGGDEVINMADFRRWRDWLLFGVGNHQLNGSADHLSLDANADGTAHSFDDSQTHPRGDFNGDGLLDLNTPNALPNFLPRTDLQVLIFSGLWEDPCYEDAQVLTDLVDSVDFHVSATNFFYKHTDISEEVNVTAYDAGTQQPVVDGGICIFSPDEPEHILTVPTGAKYFVASDPISIGAGTNVAMRSIGEKQIMDNQRGADFAVDLALWEMTAEAHMLNPATNKIDSRPLAELVEAYLPATGGFLGDDRSSVGARAWATNSGTLYSITEAGSLQTNPTNNGFSTTWSSAVRWQRSFIKDSSQRDPRFMVKPMSLYLAGFGPNLGEMSAIAEIIVEMRAYDISPGWQPVFIYHAQIAGKAASGGNPHTFRIELQEGDLPDKALELSGTFSATYTQERHRGRVNLDGIPDGHSFELRYRLFTETYGRASDNGAGAALGDPLVYGSGVRMEYGGFGDLPRINRVTTSQQRAGFVAAAAQATIEFLSKTNFYFRLYQGGDAETTGLPIAMKLGIAGDDSMIDPAPLLADPTEDDYTLENQPIDQPLDLDADEIDDVYELRHPAILDPINPADAFLDPDGDGRSNLREYQDGTDPQTPDSRPTNPTLNFPGLLVPSYPGGELIDINNDGVLDSVKQNLTVALGHIGGTFASEITSPRTGLRTVGGAAYLHLDADAFLDAVLTDSLTNRVFLFRGVGDGSFTPLTNHAAISGATKIVPCNLNGDALTDLALLSRNARGASLHMNNGDGTLTQLATLTTNAYGIATGLAMADLNGDGQDDVIVGYFSTAAVFLSNPDGSYGLAQPHPVGFSPESMAVENLNQDGNPDLVTANRSSGDVSVLLGAPGGTFLPQVRYPLGDLPLGLRLVDLNGDTYLDAVVSRVSTDYQTILPGLGNGAFGELYTVPAGSSLTAIHDWNGDGNLDFISTAFPIGGIVNFGNGDGTFDTRLQIVPANELPTQVTAVDFNGDGKLELVGFQQRSDTIDVWEHAAVTGTNRLLSSFLIGPDITAYTSGDFNGDGLVDLAVTTQTNQFIATSSNQVVILINQGNFTFQDAGHYPLPLLPRQIVAGDFNGDGVRDLAAHLGGGTLNAGSQVVSLLGNGAGGFTLGTPVQITDVLISFMSVANAEADSRDELVLRGGRGTGANSTSFLEVYSADGAGWTHRQTLSIPNSLGSIQVVSMNGDAYPDLVRTHVDSTAGEQFLRMYPGGPAGFGAEQTIDPDIPFQTFTRLVDLNGDGLPDVIIGNTLILANPSGGFHPAQNIYIGAGAQGAADFNRDGKADLFSGLSVLLQK